MKSRPSFLLLCAAIIVLMALVIWHVRRPAKTSVPAAVPTQPAETVAAAPALPATNMPVPITGHVTVPTPSNAVSTPRKSKEQETLAILSTKNDVPIIFYGKLEDQFGNPVAGAEVTGSIIIYNGVRAGSEKVVVTSDGNGFFQINHGKGESLGIMPRKAGYTLATSDTEFKYSKLNPNPYEPDAGNPNVIKMWKLQGAGALVGINQTFKPSFTDEPIFFDLVVGATVPSGGDLEIIVTREPGVITQRKQDHRDWSIKLVPVNGGIMESDYRMAQVTFEAPANGYQDSYFVQMNHDDPAWFDNVQKMFFLTSRNGQVYSKFSFDFGINDDPGGTMWVQFKGVASTNGLRNWEATAPQ
jgi:hypothetical protein